MEKKSEKVWGPEISECTIGSSSFYWTTRVFLVGYKADACERKIQCSRERYSFQRVESLNLTFPFFSLSKVSNLAKFPPGSRPIVLGQFWVKQNVPIFFCQNLLFMAQAFRKWNNIKGSPCSIFQKMGPNIANFDLLKYGVNWKTVTCSPLGSNFDNF